MNSPAGQLRRDQDQRLVSELMARSQGELSLQGTGSTHRSTLDLQLNLPVVIDSGYPARRGESCRFQVQLPARYPFAPPTASVQSPVWHPNVFPNGSICLGSRWQATEGLDLFVSRIARLLIYDPLLVNLNSVAHPAAGTWYRQTLAAHPEAFPTVQSHASHWLRDPRGANAVQTRVEKPCPFCQSILRLPAGRSGLVQCPKCRKEFGIST